MKLSLQESYVLYVLGWFSTLEIAVFVHVPELLTVVALIL